MKPFLAFWLTAMVAAWSLDAAAGDREKLIFVLAGQSNMVGAGDTDELPEELKKLPSNVDYYLDGKKYDFERQGTFGPEVAFAHEISKAHPDKRIVLIKYAAGGTSLLAWSPEWKSERASITWNRFSGRMYEKLMDIIHRCNSEPNSRYMAVVWMQGERDARYPEASKEYANNLKVLVEAFRRDLKVPDLPFVLGRVNPPSDGYPGLEQVRKAQQDAEKEIPRTATVSTEGLAKNNDEVHYNAQGQMELGRRFAKAYLDLQKKEGDREKKDQPADNSVRANGSERKQPRDS